MKTRTFLLILLGTLFLANSFLSTDVMAKKPKPGPGPGPGPGPEGAGMVIFDMTANPGDVAIATNLGFVGPGSKSDTAIDDGFGFNTINIADFQVMIRDVSNTKNELKLAVGESSNTVLENQFGTEGQLQFFADGNHLFDLDRLRVAADWMAKGGNLHPDSGVLPFTYGSITFKQFLANIKQVRTMYGFVRVKIPLELGSCTTGGNCDRNALGGLVDRTTIYGLCDSTKGLCSCAPKDGYKIIEGDFKGKNIICGISKLPDDAQIRVKGSLFWDFVASDDNSAAGLNKGNPIPLSLLPWAPRELYFKVEIPIMVNWAFDLDEDGAMDNMFNIAAISRSSTEGILASPALSWSTIAPTNKAEFEYLTGKPLTQELYNTLDNASKYHLMMPNGYATGWAEAFDKLNITGAIWQSMPVQPAFGLPTGYDSTILDADAVRDNNFEDIPAYLYSGGLIDMHDHVNVSGLVYVPQGMELEAKNSKLPTRQYIVGALVVRDTFFMEAKDNTITVISSEPSTYSNAILNAPIIIAGGGGGVVPTFVTAGSPGDTGDTDDSGSGGPVTGGPVCYPACPGGGGGGSGSGSAPPGPSRWIEVRPQVLAPSGG